MADVVPLKTLARDAVVKLMEKEEGDVSSGSLADKLEPMISLHARSRIGNQRKRVSTNKRFNNRRIIFRAIKALIEEGELLLIAETCVAGVSDTIVRRRGATGIVEEPPPKEQTTLEAFQAAARYYMATGQFEKMGIKYV